MRKSKRDEIARSVAVQTKLDNLREAVAEWMNPVYGKIVQLEEKLDRLQPATVDLTQEMAGQMRIYLKTNGTLQLELLNHEGEHMWLGTFVPPDFGKAAP